MLPQHMVFSTAVYKFIMLGDRGVCAGSPALFPVPSTLRPWRESRESREKESEPSERERRERSLWAPRTRVPGPRGSQVISSATVYRHHVLKKVIMFVPTTPKMSRKRLRQSKVLEDGKHGFSAARFSVPGFPFMIFHSTLFLLHVFPFHVFPF